MTEVLTAERLGDALLIVAAFLASCLLAGAALGLLGRFLSYRARRALAAHAQKANGPNTATVAIAAATASTRGDGRGVGAGSSHLA